MFFFDGVINEQVGFIDLAQGCIKGVLGSKPEAFSWESNTLTVYVSQGIQKRNKSMVAVVPLGLLVYWLVIQYTVMI